MRVLDGVTCHLRLSQALSWAERMGLVARNVCAVVEKPKHAAGEMKVWTPEEARRFLVEAEKDGCSPLWLVALTTGARQGELLGLRWQDLDLAMGTISIRQSLAILDAKPIIQTPKSRAAVRTIALPAETVAALKAHKARQNEERLKAGALWADLDLVFATPTGNPTHPSNVLRNYAIIQKRAGVPRVRFHDLRHAHASWLLPSGLPVKVVSERLGHAKASITLDVYAHLIPGAQDAAAETTSNLLFPTGT